ncbi:hypothetical protein C8R43DRAFT_996504 [Mycena crocata]|nr:hypothetical protein C8R43DRAFT_996504 [Mycena crocata]
MGTPKKNAKKIHSQLRPRTTRSSKGRLLSDPMQNTALLTEQLRSLGLYAAPTVGDGNCLFRALSDQLYGSPSRHPQLRKDICDWIARHKSRYEPFVEDERGLDVHLRCMRENATYGGHMELSAFAHLTRRNVKVIQPGLVYVIEWAAGGPPSPVVPTHSTTLTLPHINTSGGLIAGPHSSSSSSLSSLSSLAPSVAASPSPSQAHPPTNSSSNANANSYFDSPDVSTSANVDPSRSSAPGRSRRNNDEDKDELDVIDVDGPEREVIDLNAEAEAPQEPEEGTIYVAYHDWEHFSSIRNLKGPHTGLPVVRETPPYPYPPSPTSSYADPKQSKADAKERKRLEREAKERAKREKADQENTAVTHDQASSKRSVLPKVRLKLSSASPTKSPPPTLPPSASKLRSSDARVARPAEASTSKLPGASASVVGTGRVERSPKRSFDESSGSAGSESESVAKRTRSAYAPAQRVSRGQARRAAEGDGEPNEDEDVDVDGDGDIEMESGDDEQDAEGEDDAEGEAEGETEERTSSGTGTSLSLSLSPPALSSSSSLSSLSSMSPSPPPPEPEKVAKPMTRRQRKALGLPKTRVTAAAANKGGAGKIVIPGGRYEGTGEWRRNGTGRLDVRGFRELKI